MSDVIVAVDLGTSKAACVVAGAGPKGGLEVLSLAYGPSVGVEKGSVVDSAAASTAVDSVVGKVERHLGTKVSQVWCTVGGAHLKSVVGKGLLPIYPPQRVLKRQDLHQVLSHSRQVLISPDDEQVLALPTEFIVDGQRGIADPVGLRAGRLEVSTHIVAGSRAETEALERAVGGGTRRVVGMVPGALASGLGVLSQDMMEMGTVLVDIGAATTSVGVFVDGVLVFQGVIKVGGDHFSHDIAQLLHTSFEEAERLKSEEGSVYAAGVNGEDSVMVTQEEHSTPRPMKRKMLCEIMESRGKELCEFVAAKVGESGVGTGALKSLVLTGGGSLTMGTEELFGENLGFGTVKLAAPRVDGAFAKQVSTPMLSAVVGTARYALEAGTDELAPVSGLSSWKERISTLGQKLWFGEKG